MRTATIRTSPSGIDLATPFDAAFVDAFKATVPSRGRKWDPDRKVWTVEHAYIAEAVRLLQQYFIVVDLREDATKDQQRQEHERQQQQERERQRQQHEQQRQERERHSSRGNTPYAVLHLQPTAPPELVKSAYLCLSKLFHPDRGGDLATMQRINQAYEALKR